MTIKLNNHSETYENAKKKYAILAKDENATPEQIETAWSNMQDELVNSLTTQITQKVANNNNDQMVLAGRGANILTTEEHKFFNEVVRSGGFESETVLPYTTVDRIFEDLTTEHPLLSIINFTNLGTVKAEIITSEKSGTFAWGPIFGEIRSQLDAAFKKESFDQSKLTAFVVLAKDLDKFGPAWVEAYVRTQITETYAVALEQGIILGAGPTKHEPIGLIRDLKKAVDPTNGHAKKDSTGTLTFTDARTSIKEIGTICKTLSKTEKDKKINVGGKVYFLLNPMDAWDVKINFTIQNSLGAYITALPFNVQIVESEFAEEGELVAFVRDRYDAYSAGGVQVNKYDQTLAIEDANLYTAKGFAFGKAKDNKASLIYKLEVTETVPEG
ncbi:phage major capsid protein [Peribacillus sp. TH24]|uniref:phage major capsid protein n=1 Tax=Peribacillus sp. TH24 TaxID=2798483 RepID=UPI00191438F8|nr:phage major capsid protein [Peribacillus sp. TH24]MBK5446061.1 phage major capsid protein [Peribacillus sp. TH24]